MGNCINEINRCIEGLKNSMPGLDWTEMIKPDIKSIVAGYPVRAILLAAPKNDEIGLFEKIVSEILSENGINTIVMRIGYHFEYLSHPEVMEAPALSRENAAKIADICRKNGIVLVPKINLFGHQSDRDLVPYGIIRAYPEMEESHEGEIAYCRCLCLRHPRLKPLVCDLMDDILEAFGAKDLHVGQDEAHEIGKCPRCKGIPNEILYAEWLNMLHKHLAGKGARMWMWGDRLLNGNIVPDRGAGYETSLNDTWKAIDKVSHDIMICDWHYRVLPYGQLSPAYWAKHGFEHVICPYNNTCAADQLIVAAVAVDSPLMRGVFLTTWSSFDQVARAIFDLYPKYLETRKIDGDQHAPEQVPPCYKDACTFMHLFVK